MMQGRRHGRPPHGKARAMACGSNPRALPDLRVDAAAADSGSRGVGAAAAHFAKECVTAHLPKGLAPKMDGAQAGD